MKKVTIITLIVIIISLFVLYFINTNEKVEKVEKVNIENAETINDLLYSEIYIKEQDDYVPYIVIENNYDNKVLLLRKNVLDEKMRMNEYYAYYEDCEMDRFLNETFYTNLSKQTKEVIENTNIEVVDVGYSYERHKIKKIERKIFLLSSVELGFNLKYGAGKEGKALKYFEQPNLRLAYTKDNNVSTWWLRSVDIIYDSCFFYINVKGQIGSLNAFDIYGIRPAFCVDKNLKVIKNTEIIEGETVYIIK